LRRGCAAHSGGTVPDSNRLPPCCRLRWLARPGSDEPGRAYPDDASTRPRARVCCRAMRPDPLRESSDDRCPGALRLHPADDGHVARLRIPGGRLSARQLVALTDLADGYGDGELHLTSRGNLQVRGVSADAGTSIAAALAAAGLLPSLAHDRVRNLVASPLGGLTVDEAVVAFDTALVAEPRLAELSGRFLFGIDDGTGDALALEPDLALRPGLPGEWELLVDGRPTGLVGDAARLLVGAAHRFLDIRDRYRAEAWRVRDLGEFAGELGGRDLFRTQPAPQPPLDVVGDHVIAAVPLGVASAGAWRAVAALAARIVLTPWRSVVLIAPGDPATARISLQDKGFVLDATDPAVRTSACIGRPGCGRALADVRRDALELAVRHPGRPVHVSGCERRCGHPAGSHLEAVATATGYAIQER